MRFFPCYGYSVWPSAMADWEYAPSINVGTHCSLLARRISRPGSASGGSVMASGCAMAIYLCAPCCNTNGYVYAAFFFCTSRSTAKQPLLLPRRTPTWKFSTASTLQSGWAARRPSWTAPSLCSSSLPALSAQLFQPPPPTSPYLALHMVTATATPTATAMGQLIAYTPMLTC